MRKLAILALLALGACVETPTYYYAPEAAGVVRAGMSTRVESIPQESPRGTLEVSTLGLTKGQRGEPALHVRLALANDGDDQPWRVDIREQLVDIPGVGRSAPQFANAGVQTLPTMTVPRRERRVLDLYYPAPHGVREAAELPGFDVLWQLTTSARGVRSHARRSPRSGRAPGERVRDDLGPVLVVRPVLPACRVSTDRRRSGRADAPPVEVSHDRPDEAPALVDELDAGSAMGDFDRVIGELASRRDALAHTVGDLRGWRRLRSDVFAVVLDTRRTLVDQQRLFIAAIADGHSVARGLTAETLSACRALRGLLAEVDATILRLIDV